MSTFISEVTELIEAGAIFYISHSGGKDSQAMYAFLSEIVPHDQISVVHADLGKIEWIGIKDHIRHTIGHPLDVVAASKNFFDMVRNRAATRPDVPAWPSSAHRQCTSDLKRGPIYKFIRQDMKRRCVTLAVNCMGLRTEESTARSKKHPLKINNQLSKAGRTVYDYLPILDFTEEQVFQTINRAEQEPFWAYRAGNKRLSCVFCIMGCDSDIQNGARYRPDLYQEYLALEGESGWTMFSGKSLRDRVEGVAA